MIYVNAVEFIKMECLKSQFCHTFDIIYWWCVTFKQIWGIVYDKWDVTNSTFNN